MKKFAKIMAVMLCAVLLVCGSIFGTMAYLTSTTSTLTNTFTVGNIRISLSESVVDGDGKKSGTGRVSTYQEYKLLPGGTYDKDPIIHVDHGSENCYLFVRVVNNIVAIESNDDPTTKPTVAKQMDDLGWKQLVVDENNVDNVYYYNGIAEATIDYPVFTNVYIDKDLTEMSTYSGKTIEITAYAVQEEGFDSAAAAWKAAFMTA